MDGRSMDEWMDDRRDVAKDSQVNGWDVVHIDTHFVGWMVVDWKVRAWMDGWIQVERAWLNGHMDCVTID